MASEREATITVPVATYERAIWRGLEADKAEILDLVERRERGEDVGGVVIAANTAEELREALNREFNIPE